MKNNELLFSTEEFSFILRSIAHMEQNLAEFLFSHTYPASDDPEGKYQFFRNKWLSDGIATLDFDGMLHPSKSFGSLLYCLYDWKSATKIETEAITQFWVLNDIESLCITIESDRTSAALCKPVDFLEELYRLKEKKKAGKLQIKKSDGVLIGPFELSNAPKLIDDKLIAAIYGRNHYAG